MISRKQLGYGLMALAIILITILIFVKTNVDQKAAYTCELIAENPNLEMEACPYHQDNTTSWLIMIAFGISLFILAAGTYLIVIPEAEGKDFKEVDASKLDKEEKSIYQYLKENDGSAYQSDLVKETGLSKVKMTRTLDKLENKKILERKRRGMTNLVVLK